MQLQQFTQNYGLLIQAVATWQELPVLSYAPNRQVIEPVHIVPQESLPSTEAIYSADWSMAPVQQLQKLLALLGHGYSTTLSDIVPALEALHREHEQLSFASVEQVIGQFQQEYGTDVLLEDVIQDLVSRELCLQQQRRREAELLAR